MTPRIEHLTLSGVFSLDGEDHEVENNLWLIGDDREVIVVDAPHALPPILDAIGDRRVEVIICTHAHNDHITVAPELGEATGAPVLLHPFDRVLWDMTHPRKPPTGLLAHGDVLHVADTAVHVVHTPGHSPGGVCLVVPELGAVLSGDTLFQGGPGATGRSYSDFPTILQSISDRLLTLPAPTRVLPGHGAETTIGAEAASYDDWVRRGH
jgi:glyoxylase-like metal-dependent hydrolase (beta-lactamase superfamily II)